MGSRLGDNFAEDTQVNPLGSPAVIAESAFRRNGVSPQPAAAVLRGFQPVWIVVIGPRGGERDRSADPQIAVRLAPPPASSRLRLCSGPRIHDRRAQRGH